MRSDPPLDRALGRALQQDKPFGRFEDTLANRPAQREAGFFCERQSMQKIARQWTEDHDLPPTWVKHVRPPWS